MFAQMLVKKAWTQEARIRALAARREAMAKPTAMAEVGTPVYMPASQNTGPSKEGSHPSDPRKGSPELGRNGGGVDSKLVAQRTLQHYGGARMLQMVGATNITHGETPEGHPHVTFKIPRKNGITHVKTVLRPDDTYTVRMIGVHGTKVSEKHVAHGLHAAQLASHFTRHTGMDTHL